MRTWHSADTNTGLRRQRNEDAFLGDDRLGLYLVCDGVGGRAHGEVASAVAADLIWEWIKQEDALIALAIAETQASPHHAALVANGSATPVPRIKMSDDTTGRLGAMVRGAVQNACYMVHCMGEVDPERRGMSTTASVVQVVGEMIVVGQVGDSRVYLARDGAVTQLTEDHTWLNLQIQQGRLTPGQARGKPARTSSPVRRPRQARKRSLLPGLTRGAVGAAARRRCPSAAAARSVARAARPIMRSCGRAGAADPASPASCSTPPSSPPTTATRPSSTTPS